MSTTDDQNERSASTTYRWQAVKMRRPAGGPATQGPKARRWRYCAKRNPREPLTLTIHYRGGTEAWYEIKARGQTGRFTGVMDLHTVISEINHGSGHS